MRPRITRRRFLGLAAGALAFSIAPASRADRPSPPCRSPFRIGLGEDPARLLDGDDPEAPPVWNALRPDIACAWLNGYQDGPAVRGDLSYFRHWHRAGRFARWGAQGIELMIIT